MKKKIASISILANLILTVGKIAIGSISHSSSVFVDGIHSLVDIFSSAISFWGIKISQKPSDKKHPYGYYKFEVLAGLLVTLILFATGVVILYESYKGFFNPQPIDVPILAISVMTVSAVVNEIMARLKINYGKKENSIALLSDGFHSRIDVFASLAILIGLSLSKYWLQIDSVLAFLIGLYIIKESVSLGKEATDSLLDSSAGPEIEEKIKSIIKSQGIKFDSLRTQKKGSVITADLEIELPSKLSVEEASKVSEKLRRSLMEKISNLAYVVIQVKTHELETGFYKPMLGKGFGWQRKGRFREIIEKAEGKGPGGFCVCPNCGYKIKHKSGIPCFSLQCPKCRVNLERK